MQIHRQARGASRSLTCRPRSGALRAAGRDSPGVNLFLTHDGRGADHSGSPLCHLGPSRRTRSEAGLCRCSGRRSPMRCCMAAGSICCSTRVWLAIFATPVARRYGAGADAGDLSLSRQSPARRCLRRPRCRRLQILIGASGGVAGLTGAAVRFMFQPVIVARIPRPASGGAGPQPGELCAISDRNPRTRCFMLDLGRCSTRPCRCCRCSPAGRSRSPGRRIWAGFSPAFAGAAVRKAPADD